MPGLTLPPTVRTVTCSLHPAFALRSGAPQYLPLIHAATARASRWASLGTVPTRDFNVRIEPTFEEAMEALRRSHAVAVDVETPRDAPKTLSIVGIATSPRDAFVWRWSPDVATFIGGILSDPAILKIGHNFAYDVRAFRANSVEVEWPVVDTIQAAALLWPPFAEAKDRPWLRLPWCVTRIVDGFPYWKEPESPTGRALYRRLFPGIADWQIPLAYCGLDCIATWRTWNGERELLVRDGMLPLLEEVVAPAAMVLTRLEERGLPLDCRARDTLRLEAETIVTQRKAEVQAAANVYHQKRVDRIRTHVTALALEQAVDRCAVQTPPIAPCPDHPDYAGLTKRAACPGCATVYATESDRRARVAVRTKTVAAGLALLRHLGDTFDTDSNDAWRWLLFDNLTGLGLKPTARTTKTKKPKVDDDAIDTLGRRHPDIAILRARTDLQHASRRLSNILGVEPEADGCVHFVYSMHRTETGRIASGADDADTDKYRASPGNAQNIPDRDRVIYAPLAADRVFVQADWKQAEARVLAWLAHDDQVLGMFRAGVDPYEAIAGALYGIPPKMTRTTYYQFDGVPTSARQIGKKWRLARNYGMGPVKWARLSGMPIKEAMRLDATDRAAYPRLYQWQDEIVAEVERHGYLRNPFGRLLRFHRFTARAGGRTLEDREEALAFLPQSTVGDMCKAVLPRIDGVGAFGTVVLRTTTHDSFLLECHRDEVAETIRETRTIMEATWDCLGTLVGFGAFVCPADFSVGRNWGSYHRHDGRCTGPGLPSCPKRENPEGLREWRPEAGAVAA